MPFSRRLALGATFAAAAAPLASRAQAQPAAPAASAQAPGFYRYRVGDIEVTAINDGAFARPIEGLIRNATLPEV